MTEHTLITLVEPIGLQTTDWGEALLIQCRTAPDGQITLGIKASNAPAFVMALMQATTGAEQLRQKRRAEQGQDPDPEPTTAWPLTGVQIRPLHTLRGIALVPHLSGAAIPLHLTIEQSRQIAASLLRHADEVEREAGAAN